MKLILIKTLKAWQDDSNYYSRSEFFLCKKSLCLIDNEFTYKPENRHKNKKVD